MTFGKKVKIEIDDIDYKSWIDSLLKDKELLMPNDIMEINILIAIDCISEVQNLQDCDYLINTRLIQSD